MTMGEQASQTMIRVEYENPPMRAIYFEYYADNGESDEQIQAGFAELHPHSNIRKIERGFPREGNA
jgi:hypothetical protein